MRALAWENESGSLFRYLIQKAKEMQLVTGKDVERQTGIAQDQLTSHLKTIHSFCSERELPLFSSIVLNEVSDSPIYADCADDALICTMRAGMDSKSIEDYMFAH